MPKTFNSPAIRKSSNSVLHERFLQGREGTNSLHSTPRAAVLTTLAKWQLRDVYQAGTTLRQETAVL
jgi:hypothetical protein